MIDLIEKAEFDKYIVDTAPTGHALRLLTSPGLLDDWVKVMGRMRWKYRYIVETFAGRYNADEGDDFLVSMKKTIKKIEDLLRDQNRCEFIVVTIPEDMAISETARLTASLDKYGIRVKQLVMNNVLQSDDCRFCRAKRQEQDKYISQVKKRIGSLTTTIVPSCSHEVKGLRALKDFNSFLFS
jgi:arsenite-transporting ATPase